MNFYSFHIGDYQSHTAHLSPAADIAYRRMLDWCYLHERPLPREVEHISRLIRMPDNHSEIKQVLDEFFTLSRSGWVNKRWQQEVNFFLLKVTKASRAAKSRWQKEKIHADAMRMQCERNATNTNTNTNTNTKEGIPIDAYASQSRPEVPTCPQQELLALFGRHLPMLSQPRTWTGSRAAKLKQRWIEASASSNYSSGYADKDNGLTWWDSFFSYIATQTKLAQGFENNGRIWKPDLEWILTSANFAKIIDGKYKK